VVKLAAGIGSHLLVDGTRQCGRRGSVRERRQGEGAVMCGGGGGD
jgi:hypothetical protein